MNTESSSKSVLLAAAGGASLLLSSALSGCSGQVSVQKVVYDAPTTLTQAQTQQVPVDYHTIESSLIKPNSDPEPLSTIALARDALEAIYDIDAELVASSLEEDPNRIHSLQMIADFDRQHAQTLMIIIERFGWPTRELVGIKAVQGAYIAIQHAQHDPEFQTNCLALIQQQVDQGELPGAFLALMTDRVAVSRGEPQLYGTQMTMAPNSLGIMHAIPAAIITQSETLNERRSALGMPEHERFVEAIEIAYFKSIGQTQISSVPAE